MTRTLLAVAVLLGVVLLAADDARASDDLCVPDPFSPIELAHCAPVEALAGLDCADATQDVSVWTAGMLGLCDAPYGLGIRSSTARLLRAARVVTADGEPTPSPADCDIDRLCDGRDVGHVPPPRYEARDPVDPTLLSAAAPAALESPITLPAELAAHGAPAPGFPRRLDRPPRSA